MAQIVDQHAQSGGARRGVIPSSSTGIFTFKVSPGKRYNMLVSKNTGGTYDIGFYLFTAEDDTDDSMTRNWAADITGITDAQRIAASVIGMVEIGVNIAVASSTDIEVELRECKL